MLIGNGPIGKFAITEKNGTSIVAAVLLAAGVGVFTPVPRVFAASTLASAGVGAFSPKMTGTIQGVLASSGQGNTSYVLRSFNGAVLAPAGVGVATFSGSQIENRSLNFVGSSSFQAISYAFFLDAEKAIPDQELRTYQVAVDYRVAIVEFDPNRHPDVIVATAPAEVRVAIVPAEDRVYQVGAEPRGSDTPNRKRR